MLNRKAAKQAYKSTVRTLFFPSVLLAILLNLYHYFNRYDGWTVVVEFLFFIAYVGAHGIAFLVRYEELTERKEDQE